VQQDVLSYNNWLREQSQDLLSTLRLSMAKLLDSQQELESLSPSATIMARSRVQRIIWAVNHLEVEIHLLVISLEEKK